MEKLHKVKVVVTIIHVEPFLTQVQKHLTFKGDYFENCDTIEEIRDMFLEEYNPEDRIEYLEVYTYLDEKSYIHNDLHEYIGE